MILFGVPIRAQSGPFSSDGRQFIPDEADYDDIHEFKDLDRNSNDLILIEFRKEIGTKPSRMIHSVRKFDWDALIERGLRPQ